MDENISAKESDKLSVVFSFRNEEDVLPELINRTRNVLELEKEKNTISSWELIFVNDASTDHSLDILIEHTKGHSDIRIINMSRCFGVSPCVLAGMAYSSGDAVIYMDADLQDPPEVIPDMIKAWRSENVDIVHTVRSVRMGESRMKLFVTKIGYFILRLLSNVDLQREAGDFKLLSRRAVNHLVQLKEKNPFMRGLVCWIGFKCITISYGREPRFSGKTKFPIGSPKVATNFLGSAVISFSAVPLQLSLIIGLMGCFTSLAVTIYALSEKISGRAIPGWTAIMVAILFLGGVQLLTVGILGVYIYSIFLEVKNRPNYIVESVFGFNHQKEI